MPNLTNKLIIRRTLVHPSPQPQHSVAGIVDVPSWGAKENFTLRMFADDGEHISLPWFAILRAPGGRPPGGIRKRISLTTHRFLFRPAKNPRPGEGLGKWGMSWYLVNTGPEFASPVRIEVGFVTILMHGEGHG